MPSIEQHSSRRAFAGAGQRLRAFFRRSLHSPVLRNILTVVGGTAGAQALTMAFMPVITRLYGPEAYGVLGTFLSLVMMLVPVAALTYPIAIVLPRRDGEARALVRLSLAIATALATLAALLLHLHGGWLVARMGIEMVEPYLLLLPLVMFSAAALEIAQQWLYRIQRFRVTASVSVLHSLVFNSIRTVAGLIHPTTLILVATTSLHQALHALMLGIAMRRSRHGDNDAGTARPGLLELARRYSDFPLFRAPQVLINAISQHLPTVILAAFFGPAAAGFFALCKQALSVPTYLIGKSVADVYYPRIARAVHDREPVTAMLAKATSALALVGLAPFLLVVIVGPELFAWVFGTQWRMAGEFARWLALAEYVIFVSRPCVVAVPALSLQRRFLIFEVLSTSLRIGALLFGALLMGEALATVQAFAGASILIYLALMLMVLLASRRWYASQKALQGP